MAALDMDSQNTTLPLPAITTTSPGSLEDADGETKEPTGRGSVGFEWDGRVKMKVSGEGDVEL